MLESLLLLVCAGCRSYGYRNTHLAFLQVCSQLRVVCLQQLHQLANGGLDATGAVV